MQADPIGYEAGMNMYAAMGDDPVNNRDPSGMTVTCNNGTQAESASGCADNGGVASSSGGTDPNGTDPGETITVVGRRIAETVLETASLVNMTVTYAGQLINYGFESAGYGLQSAVSEVTQGYVKPPKPPKVPKFRPCGCFEAGTLVWTPSGMRPIEEIAIGDLVLAQNEKSGEIAAKPVTDLIRPEPKQLYELRVRDANGEVEIFHATDDHPWKIEGKDWVETIKLVPGDRIDTASGKDLLVTSLTATDHVARTYNLTVAKWHTFMVGQDKAVVHNVDCGKGRPGNNQAQNKQVADAARAARLTSSEYAQFRREIEERSRKFGQNLSYQDLLDIAQSHDW
jgi:hypothetical protein